MLARYMQIESNEIHVFAPFSDVLCNTTLICSFLNIVEFS
jgi:hypothetical protein